jgi:hypothetical protein
MALGQIFPLMFANFLDIQTILVQSIGEQLVEPCVSQENHWIMTVL